MVRIDLAGSRCGREAGQTMAEYGVVLTLITLAIVTVIAALAGGIEVAIGRAIALIPR